MAAIPPDLRIPAPVVPTADERQAVLDCLEVIISMAQGTLDACTEIKAILSRPRS